MAQTDYRIDYCVTLRLFYANQFVQSLTQRYRTGLVQIQWKMANGTMIPKVYPPKSIECDLRPISLVPTISKLLEAKIGN